MRLLRRNSRHVELTDSGRALLEGARRTLAAADRAVEVARRADAGAVGTVALGFSPLARFGIVPAAVRAFVARYPEVSIRSQEMYSGPLVDALLRRDVSVVFAAYPPDVPGLLVEDLAPESNQDGHLFREGRGIVLAPASARRFGFDGTASVPLEDEDATFETSVVWRLDAPAPAVRFVEVARETAVAESWLDGARERAAEPAS